MVPHTHVDTPTPSARDSTSSSSRIFGGRKPTLPEAHPATHGTAAAAPDSQDSQAAQCAPDGEPTGQGRLSLSRVLSRKVSKSAPCKAQHELQVCAKLQRAVAVASPTCIATAALEGRRLPSMGCVQACTAACQCQVRAFQTQRELDASIAHSLPFFMARRAQGWRWTSVTQQTTRNQSRTRLNHAGHGVPRPPKPQPSPQTLLAAMQTLS